MKGVLMMVFCWCCLQVGAQNDFPDSWQGSWKGRLEIYSAKGKVNEIPMEMEIKKIEGTRKYTWIIYYGEDRVAGKRDYELIVVDASKGHYRIDEKNSILIDAYLIGDRLVEWFEVEKTQIMAQTMIKGDELIWELFAASAEPVSKTGGQKINEEEIPSVSSYGVSSIQRAILKR